MQDSCGQYHKNNISMFCVSSQNCLCGSAGAELFAMRQNNTPVDGTIVGPWPGDSFSTVVEEVLEEPYQSVSWTLDLVYRKHLVILKVWGPIVWVRELLDAGDDSVDAPLMGIAYVLGWGLVGDSPYLGFRVGTIVESICIGHPVMSFPLYSWAPQIPGHWHGGHIHWRVHWLSAPIDM